MKKIIENIAELIKVKTFVTFGVIFVFCLLSIKGLIEPASVKDIVLMVISFYFGTQLEKRA